MRRSFVLELEARHAAAAGYPNGHAAASAAPKAAAEPSVKVLHLISHQTSLQVIDIGKKGPARATR